ncbi:hypothetical protein QNO11_02335 [Microbacterium sp. zg-B96]|nr:DUF6625 family protein [Microbacterium sp. zg-B96]MCR2784958.1 hypothetical protein [Microbacterium sp. zg.B96]WIM16497.1 hypothetical protein QNO11_02335 [Microbacterium sp. zg-B96]
MHLESLARNASVDWLLITDQEIGFAPANVRIVTIHWEGFRELVQARLGAGIILGRPYKICDLRPSFGELFAEYVEGYDFWGHCDLDVIFGDVRKFLTPDVLSMHDKVLIRGNFSLYRNSPAINSLYRSRPDIASFEVVMSDPAARRFDEWLGIHPIIRAENVSLWNDDVIFDLNADAFSTRANSSPRRGRYAYIWMDGKVFECDRRSLVPIREGLLIHFQRRSLNVRPSPEGGDYVVGDAEIVDARTYLEEVGTPRARFRRLHGSARFRYRWFRTRARNARNRLVAALRAYKRDSKST